MPNFVLKSSRPKFLLLVAVQSLLLLIVQPAAAQTLTTLYSFTGGADGRQPLFGSLALDAKGNLYGTTWMGGSVTQTCSAGCGTVFEVTPSGSEKVLYSFQDGADGGYPAFGVVRGANGSLYGTATETVFEVTKKGVLTTLYTFAGGIDGGIPRRIIRDSLGNLYGPAQDGGIVSCSGGCGLVFEITPEGSQTVLYRFQGGTDGAYPDGCLLRESTGNVFGTTEEGGAYGFGTVYEVLVDGSEKILYSFTGETDGASPEGCLVRDSKGNLYSTTREGGAHGKGVVFELTKSGKETVLYSFQGGKDAQNPWSGLVRDSSGNFYGTAGGGSHHQGTVFELTVSGSEKVIHTFTGGADGGGQPSDLLIDKDGSLYGTTQTGGVFGYGVVFKLTP
jgi:uncharacterized repeat protein (TIGR03803 family)